MPKKRNQIPATVRKAVLKEFNHRCAVCGADRPHLHHIDQDRSNNDPRNLVPLCPNCHLSDQHDASNAIPRAKLRLFRHYKHRHILKPQFNPVFRRLAFLSSIDDAADVRTLQENVRELVALARSLAMGEFYADSLGKLLDRPKHPWIAVIGDPESEARWAAQSREDDRQYREQLRRAGPAAEALVIEMLEYQVWS
ncbi:MAG: HNH endonuclease signature motif containing protein [Candidatus Eisenbacteria bacterium]|nr:HNH endonuclease signature motif containing protein [Candidatus Eisenbacteria bacterium]